MELKLSFQLDQGDYVLITKLVDENTCNPQKTWIDMGSPAYPTKEQLTLLRECAYPQVRTRRFSVTQASADIELKLSSNALCYFQIQRVYPETDRGFMAERIRGAR